MQYSFKKAACCSARYPAWRSTPSRTPRTPSASSCSSTWNPASVRLPAQFVCFSCVFLRAPAHWAACVSGLLRTSPSFFLLPLLVSPSSVEVKKYVRTYVCMHACMYVRMYVRSMYVCMFVCAWQPPPGAFSPLAPAWDF